VQLDPCTGEEDLRCEATHTKKVEEMRGVKRSRKVAVIGCGASGLVAARELLREGHQVSVFEQGNSVGGVWVYDPEIEADLLGINVDRKRVHSSMYASLRTNLPREIMSFTDFPFLPTEKEGSQRDARRFPGHPEVASYLQDFAEHYGLMDYIHFSSVVEYAGVREIGEKEVSWKVRTRLLGETTTKSLEEDFDAVVVCNGHYSEPYVVPIHGNLISSPLLISELQMCEMLGCCWNFVPILWVGSKSSQHWLYLNVIIRCVLALLWHFQFYKQSRPLERTGNWCIRSNQELQ
jgi:NADPH-dependent 2,4-dienoyl-CoA reductase/sulfur reductase-like enzyme